MAPERPRLRHQDLDVAVFPSVADPILNSFSLQCPSGVRQEHMYRISFQQVQDVESYIGLHYATVLTRLQTQMQYLQSACHSDIRAGTIPNRP